MKKVKLKLFEIINLHIELLGYVSPEDGKVRVEGLLNQNLSYSVKFNLKHSIKSIQKEKEAIDEVQNELIEKYGSVDKYGNMGLNRFLDEVDEKGYNKVNPNFIKYQEEWNKFVTENEREVELIELTLDDLKDVKTKDNYTIIDNYFIKSDEQI